MKLAQLKTVLRSPSGRVQDAVVYDYERNQVLKDGCSVEHAVEAYGEREVKRIQASGDRLVITI